MLVKWEFLCFVKVHRSSHGNVSNCDIVSSEEFGLSQLIIENASKPIPVRGFGINDGLVRLCLQKWLDHIFDEVDVATGEPL